MSETSPTHQPPAVPAEGAMQNPTGEDVQDLEAFRAEVAGRSEAHFRDNLEQDRANPIEFSKQVESKLAQFESSLIDRWRELQGTLRAIQEQRESVKERRKSLHRRRFARWVCRWVWKRLQAEVDEAQQTLQQLEADHSRVSASMWDAIQANVFEPAGRSATPARWGQPGEEQVVFFDGPALSSKIDSKRLVETEARGRIALALTRPGGTSVGIAGPRGAGKTELAEYFAATNRARARVGVRLWAPVAYQPKTFLLWLLKTLCSEVTGSRSRPALPLGPHARSSLQLLGQALMTFGPPILMISGMGLIYGAITGFDLRENKLVLGSLVFGAGLLLPFLRLSWHRSVMWREENWPDQEKITPSELAEQLYRRVEFTESLETSAGLTAKAAVAEAKLSMVGRIETVSMTELDLVNSIRALVEALTDEGKEVVVAIDEVDKMATDEEALAFINQIKILFPIKGCSFLVSVSDRAWVRFTQRGMPFRDAFDSSFDEVVRLEYLSAERTTELLNSRGAAVSDLQGYVIHALSGGLPRDVLRVARHLARAAGQTSSDKTVRSAVEVMIKEEFVDKSQAVELRLTNETESAVAVNEAMGIIQNLRHCWSNVSDVEAHLLAELVKRKQPTIAPANTAPSPPGPDQSATAVSPNCESASILTHEAGQRSRDEYLVYLMLLTTVRQLLAEDEWAQQLAESPSTHAGEADQVFNSLGRVRSKLGVDPGLAAQELAEARERLQLEVWE